MLKIAIQAKGRLNEQSMELLADAGISASSGSRKLISHAKGFPMEILYLRDDDIPQAVAMGVADIGIVGQNEVAEKAENVEEILPLGFGSCRVSIAVPREVDYQGIEWLWGKRIATSYPNILRTFLSEHDIRAEIHEIAGSVEIAPAVGMADAIFDIVSSGGTLIQNGLKEVEEVFQSQAVLIANPDRSEEKSHEIESLVFRINSIMESRGMKYVLMNLPRTVIDAAVAVLPAMKSPTILPLSDPDWCSLHAVIPQSELWEKIEQLKHIGACDILVLNLENIIR